MFLLGDIGGTTTRLARAASGEALEDALVASYASGRFPSLESLLARHLQDHPGPVRAAVLGVPGPVTGRRVRTTNLPWDVDGDVLETLIRAPVTLLNDLEAAAHGVLVLPAGSAVALQLGEDRAGTRAVLAAGTGLGEAILVHDNGSWRPCASEGGHTEFGPRDDEEVEIWRHCRARFGHVSYERLVSGPGLVLLHEFYRARFGAGPDTPAAPGEDLAAAVARAAAAADPAALAAVKRFCSIYGAEAGNLALKALAFGGVYLAGGIAPKLLDFLRGGEFVAAFVDKGRYGPLMSRIPVRVVMDEHLGLRGAARVAQLGAR